MGAQGIRGGLRLRLRLRLRPRFCCEAEGSRSFSRFSGLVCRRLAVCKQGQLIVLLDIKKSSEELTLEDTDDPVQRLLKLLILLFSTLLGPVLVLLPLVQFGSVLLEQLQGPLSIFLSHRHGGTQWNALLWASVPERARVITDVRVWCAEQAEAPNRRHSSPTPTCFCLKTDGLNF